MNVERCISLHNKISRYAWKTAGFPETQFDSIVPSYLSYWESDNASLLPKLVPELAQFLSQARYISHDPDGQAWSFFYWVDNLADPEMMFDFEEMFDMSLDGEYEAGRERKGYEEHRYILLYTMSMIGSHRVGLTYDQKTHTCIMCPSIHDMDWVLEEKTKWYPLEDVLEHWHSTIRSGRMVAVPKEHEDNVFHDNAGFHPWRQLRFYEHMLDENLDAWNALVEAIEARLPHGETLIDESTEYGLVKGEILELHHVAPGFAREFLTCARVPRFKFIAPGLQVITSSTYVLQPFEPVWQKWQSNEPPTLLFYSELDYDHSKRQLNQWDFGPLGGCLRTLKKYPAGLYLEPVDDGYTDDEIQFVLPFSVGANGFAKKSDGSVISKGFGELYSVGWIPFHQQDCGQHLVDVLKNWMGMVERGDWQVDEEGIVGGMDVWKQADTEEPWEKYVIPSKFFS